MDRAALKPQLLAARDLARQGRLAEAEAAFGAVLQQWPDSVEAAIPLARLAAQRGDPARAGAVLSATRSAQPAHEMLAVELAVLLAGTGDLAAAIATLQDLVARQAQAPFGWLLLGQMLEDRGDAMAALLARYEAIRRAQAAGEWTAPATTPPHLHAQVAAALSALRQHRREVFQGLVEPLRQAHGGAALQRVDRALAAYLGDWQAAPTDSMQKPLFFYMPDLPTLPYVDPYRHDWAPRLAGAFTEIRDEALSLVLDEHPLEDFVKVRAGDTIGNYLGGLKPSWEAFFFYRHGQRYDDNHARCPRTSAVLDSLDLCRIPGQTPEILFSVLAPGTHILPHHGVTNTRCVMHLPLVVPEDCALHLVDRGVHHWREGELVMFDDTFLHESWNRSGSVRIIVLMDCWNPDLTRVERDAVTQIAQAIGALDIALQTDAWQGMA